MPDNTYLDQIDLSNKDARFIAGFMAAINFLAGSDSFQLEHADHASVTLRFAGTGDNARYRIIDDNVKFAQTGVEL